MVDKKLEENIAQFCAITGASVKDARKFLENCGRVDSAIDAYYTNPHQFGPLSRPGRTPAKTEPPSSSKLNALFDKYKDPDEEDITIDGTIKFCSDLKVDPEDVVLLAIAYELKSPKIGQWERKGWVDGWKALHVDSIQSIAALIPKLRNNLASDPRYFSKVYAYTFEFAKSEGQRSLALETAQAFWGLLLPHGLSGGALAHIDEDGPDVRMKGADAEEGFKEEYVQWWFDFLNEKGGKGVSKDTWMMLRDFIRTIDSQFKNYDEEAAWPSTIDEFVEYARKRLASQQ